VKACRVSAAEQESASRELALQELHAAAHGYKAELDTSTARVKALEEEVAALQERTAEASSYELALQELQSAADGYKAELEDRSAEASSYELALQELHSAADGYKAELDASTARVKALEEEVAALQRDKERASSCHELALQELQSAYEKMQNEWRTAEGCKAEVDEASTARVQALQEEIVALQAKAGAASSREEALQELQSAADGYKAELAAKMQEVPALEHMCITFILHIYNICIYVCVYIYRWMRWSEK
jgi:polyhydroxyalkanoate synthesis regulator phasin